MIQNRSNFFNYKNKHQLNFYAPKSSFISNFTSLLNNSNSNGISLRELYRTFNKENKSFSLLSLNAKKKKHLKKRRIKTYDDKRLKNHKNIFQRNTRHKLMNVQYDLEKFNQNKYKNDIINIFQKTFSSKRVDNINNIVLKKFNQTESKRKNYIKKSFNFHNNNLVISKHKNRINGELEKGFSISSVHIKPFVKNHLKNKFKNTNNENLMNNDYIKYFN